MYSISMLPMSLFWLMWLMCLMLLYLVSPSKCDPVHVQIDPGDETVACLREIVKYHCVTDGELLTWKVNGETVYSDVRSTIINGSLYIESFIEFPAIVDSEILCSGKTLDGRKQPGNQTVHLRVQGPNLTATPTTSPLCGTLEGETSAVVSGTFLGGIPSVSPTASLSSPELRVTPSSTFSVSLPSPSPIPSPGPSVCDEWCIAIILGLAVVVVILLIVCCCCMRIKRKRRSWDPPREMSTRSDPTQGNVGPVSAESSTLPENSRHVGIPANKMNEQYNSSVNVSAVRGGVLASSQPVNSFFRSAECCFNS